MKLVSQHGMLVVHDLRATWYILLWNFPHALANALINFGLMDDFVLIYLRIVLINDRLIAGG
jgi:hypothetical protein